MLVIAIIVRGLGQYNHAPGDGLGYTHLELSFELPTEHVCLSACNINFVVVENDDHCIYVHTDCSEASFGVLVVV